MNVSGTGTAGYRAPEYKTGKAEKTVAQNRFLEAMSKQALYALDYPLADGHTRSLEVQRYRVQERKFYQAFISRLEGLL